MYAPICHHRLIAPVLLTVVSMAATIPVVHAQSTSAGTVYSASGQYDEAGAYSLSAGLDHAFSDATWASLTAGFVDSTEGPIDLSTYRAGVGLDHYFDPAGLAVDVEYWGDSDTIETLTVDGELYFRTENARFGVTAAYRDIDIKYEVPALLVNLVDSSQSFASTAIGASLRYSRQAASVYARATVWSYDEAVGEVLTNVDLSRVPPALRPAIQQRLTRVVAAVRSLSSSSLTLANSLLAHAATVGFDYRFGEQTLNFEAGHDRGEVDDLDVTTLSTGWLFPVGDAVDVEVRLGVSDADTFGSSVFGGISLFVYR
jgi:hypothetical protein